MPAIMLGPDALAAMLTGRGLVTIANRCTQDDDTRILAAAIVRHGTSGEVAAESVYDLDLAAGDSETFEPLDATAPPPQAVEVLMRVFSGAAGRITDVYVSAESSRSDPLAKWEAGLRDADASPGPGEAEIPDAPSIIAYVREA